MKTLTAAFFLLLSCFTFAGEHQIRREALTIKTVEVTPIETNYVGLFDGPVLTAGPLDEISIILDGLLAIGKKIWPIIQAGKPVIDIKLAPPVSIVPHMPEGTDILTSMGNWSMPTTQSTRVSFKNPLGLEVIGFTYTVIFQYGGNYVGIGSYVTNLKIVTSDISVAWGFDFNANSELVGIANVGTTEFPIASGIINISYSAKGIFNEMKNAQSFYVDGRGMIKLLN